MDAPEFIGLIRHAWTLFNADLNLGRAMICPVSLLVDDEFRRVALRPESSYGEIYRSGLSRSAYNFILQDYAYFQFGWEGEHAWRMAYFPNPWITGVADAQQALKHWEAMEEIGQLSHEEASDLIGELPYMGSVPSIRFEYSRSQYREIAHPAAHFHIGRNTDNRWPCAVLLGPLAFCMMIARLYYADHWRPRSSFEDAHAGDCLDLRFSEVIERSQVVHEFTSAERLTLHLGRNMVAIEQSPRRETRHRPGLRRRG
jgi:hypothetical protein